MASNPYGITQVDVPGLLATYTGMKRQNLQDMYTQAAFQRQQKLDARSDQDYADTEAIKGGLKAAYDPATGAIDAGKARAAYLAGGDVPGAMAFDKNQADNQLKQLDTYTKVNSAVIGLLGNVTDQASYDAAKAQGQQIFNQFGHGMHFPQLPDRYDPAVVQKLQMQSLDTKDRLAAQLAQARAEEDARHDRATEAAAETTAGTAAGNLQVNKGRLHLAQTLADRKTPVSGMTTADLLALAGGSQ